MSCRPLLLVLTLLALQLPSGAGAEIYRWVDAQGRDHFTADLREVPRAKRAAAMAAADARPVVNRATAGSVPASQAETSAPRSPYVQTARPTSAGERIAGMSEDEWRERAGSLATDVAHLEKRFEQLEEQGADHMPLSSGRRNISHRRYANYKSRYREWERVGRKLDAAKASLERFEERARRSGVPPGWLRQ